MRALALVLALTVTGCASWHKKVAHEETAARTLLFPSGTYQHQIRVKVQGKDFGFHGVVQLRPEVILVAVLGPFDTTLLKLTDDRKTGEVRTESFAPQFAKLEPRVRQYYPLLRQMLTLPLPVPSTVRLVKSDGDGYPLEVIAVQDGKEAHLLFSDYDPHHIPGKMAVESPGYQVEVEVSSYEI